MDLKCNGVGVGESSGKNELVDLIKLLNPRLVLYCGCGVWTMGVGCTRQ